MTSINTIAYYTKYQGANSLFLITKDQKPLAEYDQFTGIMTNFFGNDDEKISVPKYGGLEDSPWNTFLKNNHIPTIYIDKTQ